MTRERVDFWLDTDNPQHVDLLATIAQMKQARSFARSVRDGLRLIDQLNAGAVELLESLYPDVVKRIQADYLARVAENGGLSVGGGVPGDVKPLTLNAEFQAIETSDDEFIDSIVSDPFYD